MGFKHMSFFALFVALVGVTQPVVAGEIMFGPLQFRATVGSMSSSAAYVSIMNHGKNGRSSFRRNQQSGAQN